MARRRLLQEASRLCFITAKLSKGSQFGHSGLPALQQAQAAWLSPALLRQFTSSPPRSVEEAQQSGAASYATHRTEVGAGGAYAHGQHSRQPSSGARPRIYIPPQWEHQGWRERDVPIVQELLAAVEARDVRRARRAWAAELEPLLAALQEGRDPLEVGPAPPPYAWKLYFAALTASNCHPRHLSELIELMQRLDVEPQAACYAMALRQMAKHAVGSPAFSTIQRMKDAGLPPTLRCYMFALESCLRASTPEFGYAKRLFEEVVAEGVAREGLQKTELGKLLMHGAREFARYRKFGSALQLLDHLEVLGLRVPAFLVADILYLATLASDTASLLQCVQRLAGMQASYQEVSGDESSVVTRPVKVEEGLLLGALEVAANRGDVQLAEETWGLLERSTALPNSPSTPIRRSSQFARTYGLGAEGEEEAEGAGAASATGHAASSGHLSDALEAAEAEAAVAADEAARSGRGGGSRHERPDWVNPDAAAGAAEAEAAGARGMRLPSAASHLALVHAYARAGQLEPMFDAIARLIDAHPAERAAAASYHSGLTMAVDALAASAERCDEAFFLLEGWAKQGRIVHVEQLNVVVAACSQIGDLQRAFVTFDAFPALGLAPNSDTYAALMQGCVEDGNLETARRVFEQLVAAGLEPNAAVHSQLVECGVVSGDVAGMMQALVAMEDAGHTPRVSLLERCVARAERVGDRQAVKDLLRRLFQNDYRIVGVDAKKRRWVPEGGMAMLTGSSSWFSREDVLREMRKEHTISNRIARRNFPSVMRGAQQERQEPS